MARSKRLDGHEFSVEAVRAAGEAFMALIHPLCELRAAEDQTAYVVVPHGPTAQLMVAVAGRAALAVVPNCGWLDHRSYSDEDKATEQENAANMLGIPREGRTPVQMLAAVIATDAVAHAVLKWFSRAYCRKAITKLARRFEQETKPSADDIGALVSKCLPTDENVRWDVGLVYIRLGWTLN